MVRGQATGTQPTGLKVQPGKKGPASSAAKSTLSSPAVSGKRGTKKATQCSCNGCGTIVTEDTKALQCDKCQSNDSWKCIECLNMSAEFYDYLISDHSCSLKWFCQCCDTKHAENGPPDVNSGKMDNLLTLVGQLLDKLTSVEVKLDEKSDSAVVDRLEAKLKDFEDVAAYQAKQFEERLTKLEKKLPTTAEKVSPHSPAAHEESCSQGLIKLAVQEELSRKSDVDRDLERRKKNIVIFRVPEKKCEDVTERRQRDKTFVFDLLDGIFNVNLQDDDIEKSYRLGQWIEGKARPLLVSLKRLEHKELIMSNLRNLKDTSIEKFRGIGLSHDLSPQDRDENKKMVEATKKEMNDEEESSAENYWFRVVGHGSRKRVIKIRKQN